MKTNLDWSEILNRLAEFATSQSGSEKLQNLKPLSSAAEAEASFQETSEAMQVLALGRRPFMESLDVYSFWHQRLVKEATLKPLELKDLRLFCLEILALGEILRDHESTWTTGVVEGLMDASEPLSAIDQIMTPEGEIRTDASETLHKLYNEKINTVKQTQSILDRLIRQHEMEPVLQDKYVTNREGRWVLPVRSGKQHSLDGIIHASSQSKQTVFMEPKEIVPLNNRLRQIELDIEEEIENLLRELSEYLMSRNSEFEVCRELLLKCDIRFAQAQLATHLQANPVTFDQDEILLNDLVHPLLVFANVDVIPNNVLLNRARRILLLSGPNAGGKTVLLKSVGLAAQMARCGLLVAAEPGSKIPFFKNIHVAVGDSQSVDQHLSTFAAHLRILNEAAQAKDSSTLLLIDEICGSTDPEEGTALARAFLNTFSANGSFGVITSHLGPLKLGWEPDSGVTNGSLEYDSKSGKPTYVFIMGVAGQSLALQTAKRVGIDPALIEMAMGYLSPEMKAYHSGLSELELMKDELRQLKEQLNRESREVKQEKNKYDILMKKFEREREKMLATSVKRAEKKIETLIEHSKVDDVFRRHERLEQIKTTMPEIVKATPKSSGPIRIETADDFARVYPPGTKIYAASIGRDGVIQSTPNSKGEVTVLSNSMRLTVPWSQLRPPHHAQNPTTEVVRRLGEVSSPLDQDRVVDVRGRSMEDALLHLETQLDTAALNEESRIKVVHGHGTDTLKRGVRGYLSRSAYVKKWKAGTPESGGDGVTWAELRD